MNRSSSVSGRRLDSTCFVYMSLDELDFWSVKKNINVPI